MGGGGQPARAGAQLSRFAAGAAEIGGGDQGCDQPLVFPRLDDEIGGALFHRLHRQIHVAMGGHQHDDGLRIDRQNARQPRQPFNTAGGATGEIHIQEQDIETALARFFGQVGRNARGLDRCEMAFQQQAGSKKNIFFVVHDKDARWVHHCSFPDTARPTVRYRAVGRKGNSGKSLIFMEVDLAHGLPLRRSWTGMTLLCAISQTTIRPFRPWIA
jgi:hypothetical protein